MIIMILGLLILLAAVFLLYHILKFSIKILVALLILYAICSFILLI